MSTEPTTSFAGISEMSPYEARIWESLEKHWERRSNPRGLPNWASNALGHSGELVGKAANSVVAIVPDVVGEKLGRAGDIVANKAGRPVLEAAAALVELVNSWALELNDSSAVLKLASKNGVELSDFAEFRKQDLKFCNRLLSRNTLRWRTAGALEGGAMGALALVPVAGIPTAMTADILVIQVLSASIATRIAYSYGFDAKDPDEQLFIQRLVRRSFVTQAAKAKPLQDVAKAAGAIKGRARWSPKLRADHRLLTGLERLMQQLGPVGARVPVQNVAKVVPFVGILIGAGSNAAVLGNVAADAQRYCQTRFLCEKYELPLPAALRQDREGQGPDE